MRQARFLLMFSVFVFLYSAQIFNVYAQSYSIRGTVWDTYGNTLSGVTVILKMENGTNLSPSYITESNGEFRFQYDNESKIKIWVGKKTISPIEKPWDPQLSESLPSKPDRFYPIILSRIGENRKIKNNKKIAKSIYEGIIHMKQFPEFSKEYLALIKTINPFDFPEEYQSQIYQEIINKRLEAIEASVAGVQKNSDENNQRLSGQLDEMAAISNAARGGSKAAQETADAAVAGVNATNQRISELDEYVTKESLSIDFEVGSSNLTAQAQKDLNDLADKILKLKGYMIEISGFATGGRNENENIILSQQRAETVVRNLTGNFEIPLSRFIYPIGYGSSIAKKHSNENLAKNQVIIKVLINRGINKNIEIKPSINFEN